MMTKVGNQTSSQDPQAVNSRIFVGNLNTFQITKSDVERLFQKYGRLAGISMHKGYAFVQFTSPFDARSACLGEDGKLECGQILDVNMVNEPKENLAKLKASKRKESGPTLAAGGPLAAGLFNAATGFPINQQIEPSQFGAKRAKVEGDDKSDKDSICEDEVNLDTLKAYDNPDILICGNCRTNFPTIIDMLEHKRVYCKLRFTCKCADENLSAAPSELQCAQCQIEFADPWDLMEHVQDAHTMNLYKLVDPDCDDNFNINESQTQINIDYMAC